MSVEKIVELISENDDSHHESTNPVGSEVAKFSILSGIQEELFEFVKKKLLDSIELQQFIVSREVEFLQKFIDYLSEQEDRGSYNNHNDLEEIPDTTQLSPQQRESALTESRNRLNGLRIKMENLLRREQKAVDYMSSGIRQVRIFTSSEENRNQKFSFNESITLQKIRLICEKLLEVDLKMEATFWISEVKNLIEKLEKNENESAFGFILELGGSGNSRLLQLINTLMDKEESKESVFRNIEKLCDVKDYRIEQCLSNIEVLMALFIKINWTDLSYREKLSQRICRLMVITLDNSDLESSHLIEMIEIFESVGEQWGTISKNFDKVFTLFESKTRILDVSQQSRITHLMRFRSIDPTPLPTSFLAATTLPRARTSVRNLTIIEHLDEETEVIERRPIEEIERELRRKIEMEMREEEEKKRKIEEEEKKKREEEEKRKREEEEKRKREEEEKRKREEEEKRKREEEENRIREEALAKEIRLKLEAELKIKAKQEAEEALKNQKELEIREYRRANPCLLLPNAQLFRHQHDASYTQEVLNGKIIGLYFSGHWCPPSVTFTPILRNFHAQVRDDFEVVFISWDNNVQEMSNYLQQYHGDWYSLPFRGTEGVFFREQLSVSSIPTLVILKPDGSILTKNGRVDVMNCQNPKALVNYWKSL